MVKSRLLFITCAFALFFFIIALKAAEVSVFGHDESAKKTAHGNPKIDRAEIVDRNGNLLATNLKIAGVYANPKEIIDVQETVLGLTSALVETDMKSLAQDFKKDTQFVWIKRNISPKEQQAVNDLGLPGIYFSEEITRVYPHGNLLAHILGYVNVDNEGLAGIERELNEALMWGSKEPLQLSIDVKIQHILRDELLTKLEEFQAHSASGMVVDVQTGETLAMVSLPDFDPNHPADATKEQKFNGLTLGVYEMGSIFKPITAAMAMDYGVADFNTTYDARTPLRFARQTISDYHGKKRILTLPEVIMYSSNIGTAKMALAIGTERQKEFLDKIGMLEKSEIEIPEKTAPQYPRKWKDINTITISFGHGIAVSPIHMAKAFIPLVNGGDLHPVTLLKKKDGDLTEAKKVISKTTSDKVRKLLRMVVKGGTGRNADAKGYLVGGKTGTAEKLENGKYSSTKVMSSFIGAFPMSEPRYVVIAIFDEPQQQKKYVRPTGGVVAAPVIKNIVARVGPILGIKPRFDDEAEQELYVNQWLEHAPAIVSAHN